MNISTLADKARTLLTGEPLRAINYGAIVVVYLAAKVLVATGHLADMPDFDGIALAVTAAIAAVTEVGRSFVFSPNTVEELVYDLELDGQTP